jgi:hypothetical protein
VLTDGVAVLAGHAQPSWVPDGTAYRLPVPWALSSG